MATDLTVQLRDEPGALAAVLEALGNAGVNVDGVAAVAVGNEGVAHILVEDGAAARKAAEEAGAIVRQETDAVVVEVEDRPGAGGEVARKVAGAGVNLMAAYLATNTRLVLVAGDAEQVRAAL